MAGGAYRGGPGAAVAVLALVCAIGLAAQSTVGAAAPVIAERPNVVVVMSDDQTVQALQSQQHVIDEIGARGATFANNFVNYSLCCPSRSTFLTGLYAHNHHVLGNAPPIGGFVRFERLDSQNDLPLWLQHSGYYTGEIGKYLNGYGEKDPTLLPPGWNEWYAVSGAVNFYNYTLNENGTLVDYGTRPRDYIDDVITGKAVDFIDRNAPASSPFFLYVAYKAPHGGPPHKPGSGCGTGDPEPPPRDFGAFDGAPLPQPPSFNEADVSDKPEFIRKLPPLSPADIAAETTLYHCELASLQGVDSGVDQIVHALRSEGALDNTLIIYTSDNGFFHGEHRVFAGKVYVYEPSIRVPLLMRGPGIPEGVTVRDLTINADLAPTIVAATHARADRAMNGISILSDTEHPRRELGRELLIEARNFAAIRTERYKFVQHDDGEQELYDLRLDPDELQNQVTNPAYAPVVSILASELSRLRECRQSGCHRLAHVEAKLHYSRGHSPSGGACSNGDVTVRLEGDDASLLVEADFTVNGSAGGAVKAPPFELVVPRTALDPERRGRVHATADLLDGRELTLQTALPPRC